MALLVTTNLHVDVTLTCEYALWLILLERTPDRSQNSLVANSFNADTLAVDCESSLQTADRVPTEDIVLPSNPRLEEGGGRSLRQEERGYMWLCVWWGLGSGGFECVEENKSSHNCTRRLTHLE